MKIRLARVVAAALVAVTFGCAVGYRVVARPDPKRPGSSVAFDVRSEGSKRVDWFVMRVTYPEASGEHAIHTPRNDGIEATRFHTVHFVVHRRLEPGASLEVVVSEASLERDESGAASAVSIVSPAVYEMLRLQRTVPIFDECGESAPPDRLYRAWRAAGADVVDIR